MAFRLLLLALILSLAPASGAVAGGGGGGGKDRTSPWTDFIPTEPEPIPVDWERLKRQTEEDKERLKRMREKITDIAVDFMPNIVGLGRDVKGLYDAAFGPL